MSETPLTPEQVKAARELLGWTRVRLAFRVGVSEKTVLTFESGEPWSRPLDLGLVREVLCHDIGRGVGLKAMEMIGPGEYSYAVAVREGARLWLTLWVKRNRNGEFFVFQSRSDPTWRTPHTSYHVDGRFHSKSFDDRARTKKTFQPPTGAFRGTVQLGNYMGHDPLKEGKICDPADFTGTVEVPSGILGLTKGNVIVDLVEPGREPLPELYPILQRQTFQDFVPWLVIRVEDRA